ncbi:MAG: hypothetical protein ACE5GX_06485 [Thermoanaerobaculia bacterium]
MDYGERLPSLPSGHPFTSAGPGTYWSSTTTLGDTTLAWLVNLADGGVDFFGIKTNDNAVWPVRGGQ